MNAESEKPLRLFVNPFALWTELALKTGEALWASAHAATVRSKEAPKVAVIPTADAPASDVPAAEAQASNVTVLPVRQASKATRFKAARKKARSQARGGAKPKAKRRARR